MGHLKPTGCSPMILYLDVKKIFNFEAKLRVSAPAKTGEDVGVLRTHTLDVCDIQYITTFGC